MINTRAGSIGLFLVILLALAGLALSGLLLDYHAKLATGGAPLAGRLCETGPRFGEFSPSYSCESALTSKWGRFPFWRESGAFMPTALLGFVYFGAAFSWFLIVGRPSGSRRNCHWFAVLLTGAGAGFAAYLAVMTLRGSVICPLCAATYLVAWLLFALTVLIWPRRRFVQVMAEPVGGVLRGPTPVRIGAPDYPPGRSFAAWALMTLAIAALGWLGYQGRISRADVGQTIAGGSGRASELSRSEALTTETQPDGEPAGTGVAPLFEPVGTTSAAEQSTRPAVASATNPAEEIAALRAELEAVKARLKDYEDDYQAVWFNFMNEPVMDIPVDPSDSIFGQADAPHTIVMFMDLQCPVCKAADKFLRERVRKYPGRLRLVVKHFPLNRTCNDSVTGMTHPAACAAAVTAEAARAVGGEEAFWRMYEELFDHQSEFAKGPKEFVREACSRIGISNDMLWKKINTVSVWDRIKEHARQGGRIGVQATPAIYYDGRKVAGWANAKFWDFVMWQERQQGGGAPAQPTTTRPATRPAGAATRPR